MLKFWKKKSPDVEASETLPTKKADVDLTDAERIDVEQSDVERNNAEHTDAEHTDAEHIEAGHIEAGTATVSAAADVELDDSDVLAATADAPPVETARDAPSSWRSRLGGSGMARGIGVLFGRRPQLDESLLEDLETTLISADVGVDTSTALVAGLRRRVKKREFADSDALLMALRAELLAMLEPVAVPLDVSAAQPFVLLMVGVNGVGKTTTIGKLAHRYRDEGRDVLLAAGDTFRAAAVEQLQAWGQRNAVGVIAQGQGADSASVIFDALQTARARGVDVLIADTAGRLHTQDGLMGELGKVARVLKKIDEQAPHEVLLVLDGSTGQNAINQVRQFREVVGVSGLVITKLDGSAKGGVVFALAREFGLPIRFLGLGEGAADLREFDPAAFVDGLLPLGTVS